MATLIIHIGIHKTGSSSLQYILWSNRDHLRQYGVLYPDAGRSTIDSIKYGHHPLAWALLGQGDHTEKEYQKLQVELDDKQLDTVLLSSEEFDRLSADQVARFRDLLAGRFDRIRVIAFLRHQTDVVQGIYGTDIVYNRVTLPIDQYIQQLGIHLNYLTLHRLWSGLGEHTEIVFVPYDGESRYGDRLIPEFLEACDRPDIVLSQNSEVRQNTSLPWYAATSVQHLWRLGLPANVVYDTITSLKRLFPASAAGYGYMSPNHVQRMSAAYVESNRALVSMYPRLEFLLTQPSTGSQSDWEHLHSAHWVAVTETLKRTNALIQKQDQALWQADQRE